LPLALGATLLLGAALVAALLSAGGDDGSHRGNKPEFRTATASMYRLTGNRMACGGMMDVYQLGVAHKTLPCGTTIQIRYGGESETVQVVDRGPYVGGREFDLTAETARRLDFSGVHEIRWRIVRGVGEERHGR
jgi:rare lipoprotein A (peptidoglycan hydrolase)